MEKHKVFEKLGRLQKEYVLRAISFRQEGHGALASQELHKTLSLYDVVETLGYNSKEFEEYYQEHNKRFRKEIKEEVLS